MIKYSNTILKLSEKECNHLIVLIIEKLIGRVIQIDVVKKVHRWGVVEKIETFTTATLELQDIN